MRTSFGAVLTLAVAVTAALAVGSARASTSTLHHHVLHSSQPQPHDQFGSAIAVDGGWAVVGAYTSGSDLQGSADVYSDSSGPWKLAAHLVSPTPQDDAWFGEHVAISGSTIAVQDKQDTQLDIFQLEAGSWVLTQTLATIPTISDLGIGLGGSLLAFPAYDPSQGEGVDVYQWSGSEWTFQAFLPEQEPMQAVINGSDLIVGTLGKHSEGTVSVYRQVSGTWTLIQQFHDPNNGQSDGFGEQLATQGGLLVVGSQSIEPGTSALGTDYVYEFKAASQKWRLVATLPSQDRSASQYSFGDRVATDGHLVVVGASLRNSDQGAVDVYGTVGGVWTQIADISSPATGHTLFGLAVAIEHRHLLVGRPNVNSGGVVDAYTGGLIK